jgi:2-methylisocitrate lyase-like PEP mutase family enzyme
MDHTARRQRFRALHQEGCFVIPNPWDVGTARQLRSLGYPALATTSSGFAFSRGLPDTVWAVSCDQALAHIREIVEAVDLPVSADFESGYAHQPDGVAENVALCVATGVAGLSIEDTTGDRAAPLYPLPLAVERIRAARTAIDAAGGDVLLTARSEAYLVGHPQAHDEAVRRLVAFAEAGADVLFAPGARTREDISAIVAAVAPKPVNVLMGGYTGLTVADLAALGVRRISLGSALARAAWSAFLRAARRIAETGAFHDFDGLVSFAELNDFFRRDQRDRG